VALLIVKVVMLALFETLKTVPVVKSIVNVPLEIDGAVNVSTIALKVAALDALNVVKAPVLADVLPIGPGDAKRLVNPVPETVLEALRVVKAPVLAVVPPMPAGAAR
jgi:hypothetical protein